MMTEIPGCESCGDGCLFEDEEGPCWGHVEVVAEDSWGTDWAWIHACSGHREYWDYGRYIEEPK
jgi:hypothetical protein